MDNIFRYATNKPSSDSQNKGSYIKTVNKSVACFLLPNLQNIKSLLDFKIYLLGELLKMYSSKV